MLNKTFIATFEDHVNSDIEIGLTRLYYSFTKTIPVTGIIQFFPMCIHTLFQLGSCLKGKSFSPPFLIYYVNHMSSECTTDVLYTSRSSYMLSVPPSSIQQRPSNESRSKRTRIHAVRQEKTIHIA